MYSEYRQVDNGRPGGFLRRRKTPLYDIRDDDGNRNVYRAGPGELRMSKPVKTFTLSTDRFGKSAGTLHLVAAPATSRERGMLEVAKAERRLGQVSKTYMRRTVRDPGSELDKIAAIMLMLDSEGELAGLSARARHRKTRQGLQAAIARGYLNAPYTAGKR